MNHTWKREEVRQAFLDATVEVHETPAEGDMLTVLDATRDMLEAATTVKITHDVVMAFIEAPDNSAGYEVLADDIAGPLRAAFEAAGFEVVE